MYAIQAALQCICPRNGRTASSLQNIERLDIKQWTGISVAECVQHAKDRSAWRALVTVSVTSDPQSWWWLTADAVQTIHPHF